MIIISLVTVIYIYAVTTYSVSRRPAPWLNENISANKFPQDAAMLSTRQCRFFSLLASVFCPPLMYDLYISAVVECN